MMIYKRKCLLLLILGATAVMFTGCAGDNYNSYDNRTYSERKMDNAAQHAEHEAVASLSAQDLKNINNLK